MSAVRDSTGLSVAQRPRFDRAQPSEGRAGPPLPRGVMNGTVDLAFVCSAKSLPRLGTQAGTLDHRPDHGIAARGLAHVRCPSVCRDVA
ncbi:hypothetical protein SAMN05444004_103223 [Jannaschia faecimaris]|uniref:Uncharacterized protein n=1 Tax=Jannaschia faecimaris TaxID=1244108 RepID=A0A1H3MZ93_9RHOB|nr:hypothetical protein [Jannaschia faecimaris]SDY82021.1 hypothetical protein SAMN05444004_103223 [Jannaschia faecimaris]